ncbi:phage protein [plant metagenome]|uniref:Phage protein n=1 Tax=plant metagenome TaxID=1297885 RepID=A0A484QM46_9ZZZZ
MITFQTDENNDFVTLPNGNLAMARDIEAVAQEAKHFAASVRTEMIHAFDQGIPFMREAFSKQPNMAQIEAALRRRIMETPDVTEILALTAALDGETLRYTATLQTTYGLVSIDG